MQSLQKLFLVCCLFCLSACALTSTAPNFNGLKHFDGSEAPVHINLTKVAVHFGVVMPFIGDASLDGTVEEFTKAAKQVKANRVRIVRSNETTLWWIFPPISFLFTPEIHERCGRCAYRTANFVSRSDDSAALIHVEGRCGGGKRA